MSSSLMNLAYMGEMGIVFNLAYIELKKTRYLDRIKFHIDSTRKKIEIVNTGDPQVTREMVNLNSMLDEMLEKSRTKRKSAWVAYSEVKDDLTHYEFTSGWIYDFFDKEVDKKIAEFVAIVTSLAILAMTVFTNFYILDQEHTAKLWCALFSIVFFSNLIPLCLVAFGRWMKYTACKCTDSIVNKYTAISKNAIDTAVGMP